MSNSTIDDPLNWTAAVLMTLNGVYGIVTNAIIVHNFFTSSSERTSFNLICTFRAVTNCIILALGMGQDIIQNIETQCFSTYSSEYLTWFPTMDNRCQKKYENVLDLSLLLFIGLLLINLATFIRIYIFYRKTDLDSKEMKQRMRKNSILFAQTILQDLAYLIDMLLTFKLSGLIAARYWTFISGTFYWECVHSFDGLIMIMFNEKLTFLKKTLFSSEQSSSSVGPQLKIAAMASPARSSPVPIG
ncbi:unnamed protein product [Caenorhabditis brenneri]